MIEDIASVVKIDKHRVWVTSAQTSACGGCLQKTECATHTLASVLKQKPVLVEVDSIARLHVGDRVVVAIDEGVLLLATVLMYLLPLFGLLLGGGVVDALWSDELPSSEPWVALGALSGLALALALIHHLQPLLLFSFYARPIVVKKL